MRYSQGSDGLYHAGPGFWVRKIRMSTEVDELRGISYYGRHIARPKTFQRHVNSQVGGEVQRLTEGSHSLLETS